MNLLKKVVFLFVFSICIYKPVLAQINNQFLANNIEVNDSNEHHVLLSIANQNFLKNNEYFHDLNTGYTLFGSNISTQIAYQPTKNWRLQTGVFIRKDFGNNILNTINPLLTLKYQKNGFSFLIGNLEGNVSHQLLEPIYNYERFINNYNESGIQVKYNGPKIWTDTWINWEVMEYNYSNFQEEFSAGNSSKFLIFDKKNYSLHIPFQGLITHRGGQIDIDTNEVQSKTNFATGFIFRKKMNGFFSELNTQNYFLVYKELAPSKTVAIESGQALYLNAEAKTKHNITANISYWKSHNYLAPRGGDLFQSFSSTYTHQSKLQRNRELVFLRLIYQKELFKNLKMDIRFEPYYDVINKFIEHSYSFYITYQKDFNLLNEKKHRNK